MIRVYGVVYVIAMPSARHSENPIFGAGNLSKSVTSKRKQTCIEATISKIIRSKLLPYSMTSSSGNSVMLLQSLHLVP